MDLERQEHRQERGVVSDIILGGMAAVISLNLLERHFRKIKILPPPTIPPIIIKPNRGALEIAYRQKIQDPDPNIMPKIYKIDGFEPVKEIDVQYSDSNNDKTFFTIPTYPD